MDECVDMIVLKRIEVFTWDSRGKRQDGKGSKEYGGEGLHCCVLFVGIGEEGVLSVL